MLRPDDVPAGADPEEFAAYKYLKSVAEGIQQYDRFKGDRTLQAPSAIDGHIDDMRGLLAETAGKKLYLDFYNEFTPGTDYKVMAEKMSAQFESFPEIKKPVSRSLSATSATSDARGYNLYTTIKRADDSYEKAINPETPRMR